MQVPQHSHEKVHWTLAVSQTPLFRCSLLRKHQLIHCVQKTCNSKNANWHEDIWEFLAEARARSSKPNGEG